MSELATRESLNGSLSALGLRIKDASLPFEEFEGICFVLGQAHTALRFAIGDALMYGEELYGESAYQAFEALNLSEEAKQEYRRVSSRVSFSNRRAKVSWSHHRAVAALPPSEQRSWLKRAADENLSHHQLREALRDSEPPASPTVCRCCHRPL